MFPTFSEVILILTNIVSKSSRRDRGGLGVGGRRLEVGGRRPEGVEKARRRSNKSESEGLKE